MSTLVLKKRARDESDGPIRFKHRKLHTDQPSTSTFPFLNLPGELRNHIYSIAMQETRRLFPSTSFLKADGESPERRSIIEKIKRRRTPLPFFGLTQTCTQIRSEFYSQWLNQVCIPVCAAESFISTFFPPSPRTQLWRGVNHLRVLMWRPYELGKGNIIRLFELRNVLPNITIELERHTNLNWYTFAYYPTTFLLKDMERLLNNRHPSWLQWLRSHTISHIHFYVNRHPLSIVVKEEHAPEWVRSKVSPVPDMHMDSLGLGWAKPGQIDFTVDKGSKLNDKSSSEDD